MAYPLSVMFPDALILAGGLGTRLQSALPDTPKVLAPVGGHPFITYLLDQLLEAGTGRVVISTGFRADQVRLELGDEYHGMQLVYSEESSPLGTAGALQHAVGVLPNGFACVMNGDSFVNADLRAYYEWHCRQARQASLLLAQVEDASRYGTVHTDEHDNVISFLEKEGIRKSGWINAGVYLISRAWIAEMPASTPLSLEREILPRWAKRGLGGYRTDGAFIDIGTPQTWGEANVFFERLRRISSSTSVL